MHGQKAANGLRRIVAVLLVQDRLGTFVVAVPGLPHALPRDQQDLTRGQQVRLRLIVLVELGDLFSRSVTHQAFLALLWLQCLFIDRAFPQHIRVPGAIFNRHLVASSMAIAKP